MKIRPQTTIIRLVTHYTSDNTRDVWTHSEFFLSKCHSSSSLRTDCKPQQPFSKSVSYLKWHHLLKVFFLNIKWILLRRPLNPFSAKCQLLMIVYYKHQHLRFFSALWHLLPCLSPALPCCEQSFLKYYCSLLKDFVFRGESFWTWAVTCFGTLFHLQFPKLHIYHAKPPSLTSLTIPSLPFRIQVFLGPLLYTSPG